MSYYYLGITNLPINSEKAQKVLRVVPYAQGFHFFMSDGHYSGETAMSLASFLKDIEHIDFQSIRFHFARDDFQKWLRTTIGDDELAQRIDSINKAVPDELLVHRLIETVQKRISELQSIDA